MDQTTNKYKLKKDEFLEEYPVHSQVKKLLEIPQYEQRSKEWFDQRATRLTSSDIDTVLGQNKYSKPVDVLFKKCGLGRPFTGNIATRHGQKYEDQAIELYCEKFNKRVYSFGLLPHPTIEWIGGSPDDITHDGIVIEVKCPLFRNIEMGKIPKHYEAQIKMNMEIADLDHAVFIEYKPATEDSELILNIVEFKRDKTWFDSVIGVLEIFWNEVLYYRHIGIDKHPLYSYYLALNTEKVCINIENSAKCILNNHDKNIIEMTDSSDSD